MIEFLNIRKEFAKDRPILDNINFKVEDGELMVLLGNSGSGKTSLLKLVNKLLLPTSGTIFIDNEDIGGMNEISLRRRIGYVIQQIGLFPHMTVKENIEIVGRIQKKSLKEIDKNTKNVMEMIGLDLDEFLYRRPSQLSGGQQQRIGVARALSTNPGILLMDEPFSALDPLTRVQLQDELLKIQSALKKTIIFVTHDIDEAIKLADRICLLNEGRIEQIDIPKNLMKFPKSNYVTKFLGSKRLLRTPKLLTVADIMSDKIFTVSQDESHRKAIEMLKDDKINLLCAVDENGIMRGKITEKILMGKINTGQTVKNLMKIDFDFVNPDILLSDALQIMKEKLIYYLPVLDKDNKPVGVLHIGNLFEILSDRLDDEGETG